MRNNLPHIIFPTLKSSEPFTYPSKGGYSLRTPERNRYSHGSKLLTAIREVQAEALEILAFQEEAVRENDLEIQKGSYVGFEAEPGFSLKLESLEDARYKIEVVSVKEPETEGNSNTLGKAAVFVPEGRISILENKFDKYLTSETATGNPANKGLVESISEIYSASIEDLWTDIDEFPEFDEVIWWEAWLRAGTNDEERKQILQAFQFISGQNELTTGEQVSYFPENTVILIKASAAQLNKNIFPYNLLAELRKAKKIADFYLNKHSSEQRETVDDILPNISYPLRGSPAVCLLDTGVNREHPLLKESLSEKEMGTYEIGWGVSDNSGHGTAMAGISLYGDLAQELLSGAQIDLAHHLESVKIIPSSSYTQPEIDSNLENPYKLYGSITSDCVEKAESFSPNCQRALCLTLTADSKEDGKPSSWSAAIDKLCFEKDINEKTRLFLAAAGNIRDFNAPYTYPSSNYLESVRDPAQAWNALTIGAFTEKLKFLRQQNFPMPSRLL